MEDRRRRNVAFTNLAKEMLRYLQNSEEVKVGITEQKEQLEVPVQIGTTLQQVAQQARNEIGQKFIEIFWQEEEEELCIASWARWAAQWKGLVELERRCQDTSQEIRLLNKRQEMLLNAIEGKLKMQSRANERLHDRIIEEIKEVERKKTEEALNLVMKETDLWRCQNEKEEAKTKIAGRQEIV